MFMLYAKKLDRHYAGTNDNVLKMLNAYNF